MSPRIIVISFIVMFILMYSMVNKVSDTNINLNQIYMASIMTSAMVAMDMIAMGHNSYTLIVIGIGLLSFIFLRQQILIMIVNLSKL